MMEKIFSRWLNVVIDEVFEKFATVENVDGIKLDVTARKVHPDAHW